ncbi:glycosyltransferase [Salinispirillum marinum]|uniref:Glycosyltransferase n=2 Tax=Saccharospirillaceae TaxID=255527 RepID=A0ABV8BHC8_9GAMM
MKLKEFLPSLIKMARLKQLDPVKLNQEGEQDVPVIVSCTSIPSRFHVLDKTVRSVLNQSCPPKKMLLWLHERHKNSLPKSLLNMQGHKFEIRFTELDSPHCKLVPTLLAYPKDIIVTCDDDLIYEDSWLETLYKSHKEHNNDIIAHIARVIRYDDHGITQPYRTWSQERQANTSHNALIPMGYGGVLYPSGSLPQMATDTQLYNQLAPKADDLWFKAMSTLNGTKSRTTSESVASPYPMPNSQTVSLKKSNVRQDGNRVQWEALVNHFPMLKDLTSSV